MIQTVVDKLLVVYDCLSDSFYSVITINMCTVRHICAFITIHNQLTNVHFLAPTSHYFVVSYCYVVQEILDALMVVTLPSRHQLKWLCHTLTAKALFSAAAKCVWQQYAVYPLLRWTKSRCMHSELFQLLQPGSPSFPADTHLLGDTAYPIRGHP